MNENWNSYLHEQNCSTTNSYKWSILFSIHFQLKYPLLFDRITISGTPCILWRRVRAAVSTDQRARSSFASLFFFSRVYLRDRIRKQPAFSFFYHEFPDLHEPSTLFTLAVPPGSIRSMEIQIEFELFAGIF